MADTDAAPSSDAGGGGLDADIAQLVERLGRHRCRALRHVGDSDCVLRLAHHVNEAVAVRLEVQGAHCAMYLTIADKCAEADRLALLHSYNGAFGPDAAAPSAFPTERLVEICQRVDEWLATVCQGGAEESTVPNPACEQSLAARGAKKGKSKGSRRGEPEAEVGDRPSKMRPAQDVIDRILWDDAVGRMRGNWIVGYTDRFTGLQERPFTEFTWAPFDSTDPLDNAIPRHRIQHFRYGRRTLWDRPARIDLVFGSVGVPEGAQCCDLEVLLTEEEQWMEHLENVDE